HVHPGSDALTFGMLGCDLHCSYCFPGDTPVITGRGPMKLADVFGLASRVERTDDAEIAYPEGLHAVAASGTLRPVRAVFKHRYRVPFIPTRPSYLPELRCTPDPRVYATADRARPPDPPPASRLTGRHFLAVPRQHAFGPPQMVQALEELGHLSVTYRVP